MNPVEKNKIYTVDIEDLTYEGMGVAKIEGYPIFVSNALPGEQVEIKILKVTKKYAFAKVENWKKQSDNRIEIEDIKWTQTGITPLQHMSYESQLSFKQQQVQQCLHKQHLDEVIVHQTMPSVEQLHYRNKAQVPVRVIDGNFKTGFYRKNSHDFIPMEHFGIQKEDIDQALHVICHILDEFGVTAYNEREHTGVMRHIMIRQGYYSHEMMVVLVTRKNKLFHGDQIAKRILEEIPSVVSVMQNVNPDKTNVIMGNMTRCLAGKDFIEDQMLNHTFKISAQSFYQVNTPQAEAMYQKAIDLANLNENQVAIDAYCGIGTIALSVAPYVKEVYGVEIVDEAIKNAKENARINHIDNAYFEAGKADHLIKRWQREGIKPDIIFVDPPRKGLDASFIDTVSELQPKKVAYISCNPATLARDLVIFKEKGYTTKEVFPYDMFPQTTHVECVTLLEKGQ